MLSGQRRGTPEVWLPRPGPWKPREVAAQARRRPGHHRFVIYCAASVTRSGPSWLRLRRTSVTLDLGIGVTVPTCHRGSAGRWSTTWWPRRSDLGDGPALEIATGPASTDRSWRVRGGGRPDGRRARSLAHRPARPH